MAATASLDAKINDIKNKIPYNTDLTTTTALTAVKNKIPNVSNLLKKMTIAQKLLRLKLKLLLILIMVNILLLKNVIS